MANAQKKISVAPQLAALLVCILGAAWTCHGVLAGTRTPTYTLEESLRLLAQATDDQQRTAACAQAQRHIIEAIRVIRQQGVCGPSVVRQILDELK